MAEVNVADLTVEELAQRVRDKLPFETFHPYLDVEAMACLAELVRRAEMPWSYREANARADAAEKTLRFRKPE